MGPNWLAKFLSFDEMIGAELTKITYLIGLVIIIGWALLRVLGAILGLFGNFAASLGTLIAAPLQALVAVFVWRLLAEVAFIYFRDHGTPPAPVEDAPKPYTDGFTIDAEENEAQST